MTLFLTSSPCDHNVPEGLDLPCIFDARNGFVENLRASVEPGAQLLIIASDPDAFAGNDEMAATFEGCFAAAEIELEDVCVLDSRNADDAAELVAQSGVILLSGGHVPTENAFFASMYCAMPAATFLDSFIARTTVAGPCTTSPLLKTPARVVMP